MTDLNPQFIAPDKYTDRDVRENGLLRVEAEKFLHNYCGDFTFLIDARNTLHGGYALSVSTIRGVLNCMRADSRMAGQLPDPIKKPELTVVSNSPVQLGKKKTPTTRPCDMHTQHRQHNYNFNTQNPGDKPNYVVFHCNGVQYKINRERNIQTLAWTGAKFTRAETSSIIHNVQTRIGRFASPNEVRHAQGFVDWYNRYNLHQWGYGEHMLFIYLDCSFDILKNPALYTELPDFDALGKLLGKPVKRCTRCTSSGS